MKKAVIQTGGKQYLVEEGQMLEVELLKAKKGAKITLAPLLIIDGAATTVGTPEVEKAVVTVEVVEEELKSDKVTAIRYKAKKRVRKVHGHRQRHTAIKVLSIV